MAPRRWRTAMAGRVRERPRALRLGSLAGSRRRLIPQTGRHRKKRGRLRALEARATSRVVHKQLASSRVHPSSRA
eukprot:810707-Alexandrium_andersonii.AAC.1